MGELRTLIGCSQPRIVQLVQEKKIRAPLRGPHGEMHFDPLVVCRFLLGRVGAKATTKGELAIRAFELFKDGAGLDECVRVLNCAPEMVRDLHRQWRTPLGQEVDREKDAERAHDERMKFFEDEERKQRDDDARAHEARMRILSGDLRKRKSA